MQQTRRQWLGQQKNDSFRETHNPEEQCGLADDKAYLSSLKTKRPESLTVQQIRKINTIALTGIEAREKPAKMLASLYRKKADATKYFEEELLLRIIEDIELIERMMEV